MRKFVLLVLLFSLSAATLVAAQSKKSQKEILATTYHNSKVTVKSNHYQFVAHVIHNSEERELLEGSRNQIRINKIMVNGQLHGFSKNGAVHTINDDKSKINTSFDDDKQLISIEIKTTGYEISIEVKPNGNAFLTLMGNDNSKLTYTGNLKML